MKKFSLLILSIINAIATAVFISLSPLDIVPSHYNAMGEIDAYSSKWFCMIMPCILIVLALIYLARCIYAEKIKPEYYEEKREFKIVISIFILFLVIFWYLNVVCINSIKNISDSLIPVLIISLGGFIMYLSNMYGKLKQNNIVGIRIMPTLNSEYVWKKTHRFGGYMGVISGLLMIVMGIISIFIDNYNLSLFFIALTIFIILNVIIPIIYSYIVFSKEKSK